MTKLEAIQCLNEGSKLTHRFFLDNEYIYMKNGDIYFENGISQEAVEFWGLRKSEEWNKDWQIYSY